MKFTPAYCRDLAGQRIDVQVDADDGECIANITVTLDGAEIASEILQANCTRYQQIFRQRGSASPGMLHALIVEAENDKGVLQTSVTKWTDDN